MNNNNKTNQVLNHHSALTTFKLKKGKYYKVGVEKSIFALLLRAQKDIRKTFKEYYKEILNKIEIESKEADIIIDKTFSNQDIFINIQDINQNQLEKIIIKILEYQENKILSQTTNESEILKLKKEIKLNNFIENNNSYVVENILSKEIINEIKDYCKSLAIDNYIDAKTIDFTLLSNEIGTNGTLLKKEIKKAVGTILEFNYINKKNLDIDVTSTLISSVKFTHEKNSNMTWMTYQIPREILELLLMPKMYVPLDGLVVTEIKGQYTYRMYSLFKDHLKRGWIELTKEELFNFFDLPNSYKNKTNLTNKFLEPAILETEKVSGIKSTYTFSPLNNWKKIKFDFKIIKNIETHEINIITKEEKLSFIENDVIKNAINNAKRNIYASRFWSKRVDNKISKIYMEKGEEYTTFILKELYKNLNAEIKTTLVQYINGIIRNNPKSKMKKTNIQKETPNTINNSILEKKDKEILETNNFKDTDEIIYSMYLKMEKTEQEQIEEKAKNKYLKQIGNENFDGIQKMIFEKIKKSLILEIIKTEN